MTHALSQRERDTPVMGDPTLYERLGGAVGVDAAVQALHQQIEADAERASLERERVDERHRADVVVLTRILGGAATVDPGQNPGVLIVGCDVVRHLRDALWLLGVSRLLVEEVIAAVVAELGHLGLPAQA